MDASAALLHGYAPDADASPRSRSARRRRGRDGAREQHRTRSENTADDVAAASTARGSPAPRGVIHVRDSAQLLPPGGARASPRGAPVRVHAQSLAYASTLFPASGPCTSVFSVLRTLGQGAFGTALLVRHTPTGQRFVIKCIDISHMDERTRAGALGEVNVLASLNHPNVCAYQASFVEGKHLHIVLEYCEGGDLAEAIKKAREAGGVFTERRILRWFVQLASALSHVHGQRILHRDLKASNVFLTRDETVKLGDFGIARVLHQDNSMASTVRDAVNHDASMCARRHAREPLSVQVIGTPYYMSPELINNEPYSYASDVWALGCVLYEMCTLRHAFDASNMCALVLRILRGSYPPIDAEAYSPALRGLVDAMLQQDPSMRPTMREIVELPLVQATLRVTVAEQHHLGATHLQHAQESLALAPDDRAVVEGGSDGAAAAVDGPMHAVQVAEVRESDGEQAAAGDSLLQPSGSAESLPNLLFPQWSRDGLMTSTSVTNGTMASGEATGDGRSSLRDSAGSDASAAMSPPAAEPARGRVVGTIAAGDFSEGSGESSAESDLDSTTGAERQFAARLADARARVFPAAPMASAELTSRAVAANAVLAAPPPPPRAAVSAARSRPRSLSHGQVELLAAALHAHGDPSATAASWLSNGAGVAASVVSASTLGGFHFTVRAPVTHLDDAGLLFLDDGDPDALMHALDATGRSVQRKQARLFRAKGGLDAIAQQAVPPDAHVSHDVVAAGGFSDTAGPSVATATSRTASPTAPAVSTIPTDAVAAVTPASLKSPIVRSPMLLWSRAVHSLGDQPVDADQQQSTTTDDARSPALMTSRSSRPRVLPRSRSSSVQVSPRDRMSDVQQGSPSGTGAQRSSRVLLSQQLTPSPLRKPRLAGDVQSRGKFMDARVAGLDADPAEGATARLSRDDMSQVARAAQDVDRLLTSARRFEAAVRDVVEIQGGHAGDAMSAPDGSTVAADVSGSLPATYSTPETRAAFQKALARLQQLQVEYWKRPARRHSAANDTSVQEASGSATAAASDGSPHAARKAVHARRASWAAAQMEVATAIKHLSIAQHLRDMIVVQDVHGETQPASDAIDSEERPTVALPVSAAPSAPATSVRRRAVVPLTPERLRALSSETWTDEAHQVVPAWFGGSLGADPLASGALIDAAARARAYLMPDARDADVASPRHGSLEKGEHASDDSASVIPKRVLDTLARISLGGLGHTGRAAPLPQHVRVGSASTPASPHLAAWAMPPGIEQSVHGDSFAAGYGVAVDDARDDAEPFMNLTIQQVLLADSSNGVFDDAEPFVSPAAMVQTTRSPDASPLRRMRRHSTGTSTRLVLADAPEGRSRHASIDDHTPVHSLAQHEAELDGTTVSPLEAPARLADPFSVMEHLTYKIDALRQQCLRRMSVEEFDRVYAYLRSADSGDVAAEVSVGDVDGTSLIGALGAEALARLQLLLGLEEKLQRLHSEVIKSVMAPPESRSPAPGRAEHAMHAVRDDEYEEELHSAVYAGVTDVGAVDPDANAEFAGDGGDAVPAQPPQVIARCLTR